jgi:phage shock protein A
LNSSSDDNFNPATEVITMSIFKRLSATLVSGIDKVVGEIENHDAVIQASLDEMRKKVAEAKVRLGQVRREEAHLQQQIQEQQSNIQRWRQRAIESAKGATHDEAKALECLQRSRRCQQQIEKLEQARARYLESADKLARDIESSEQRLLDMKQKHTLMRARQSTSSALNATADTDSAAIRLLDDSFERWEINISQTETVLDMHDKVDSLEREFITQEQQQALRNELAALLDEGEKK